MVLAPESLAVTLTGSKFVGNVVSSLFGREIIDGDVGALARIGDGGGTTHAGIAAGDQRLSSC